MTEIMSGDKAAPEPLFPVVLNKNHAPRGRYEIIGYLRPKVERKDSAGKMIMVEPEKFIEGEMHPAPYPGTGFPDKVWAGTHIKLPIEEAKDLIAKKIADRADVLAA
ncbi:MAG: hypothetical protein AB7V39_02490 [Nitrospiraceae bacterium]